MARLEVKLKHGLTVGNDCLTEAVLREPTAGDILTAQEQAEKLQYVLDDGKLIPTLLSSPALMGAHLLCCQIVRIGDLSGPLALKDFKRLHPEDLALLQQTAEQLDGAIATEAASQAVTQRGRDDASGGDAG